jgi:hypothetical protein
MDHTESIRLMAAEKYLLGELSDDLREAFEEHYFSCQESAQDLRTGTAFVAHTKVLLANQGQPAPEAASVRRETGRAFGWFRPALWAPAMAALLIVLGYQNFVTYPKLSHTAAIVNRPSLLASVSLISANARGAKQDAVKVHKGEPFLLYVDIPSDPQFTSYSAELRAPSGTLEWSLAIPADKAKDTLPIRVPAARDGGGTYSLVVSGITGRGQTSEVARYSFELQLQE